MGCRLAILGLFACLAAFAQNIPVSRLAATCITSGAAKQPDTRSFNGTNGLQLTADFKGNGATRACWDFAIRQDLRQMSALRIRYRCLNAAAASQFNVYVKAGNGWYSAQFFPQDDGGWHEAIIPKSSFLPENSQTSWQSCSLLRLAVWRSLPQKTDWQIADVELMKPNVSIALLRSGANARRCKEAMTFAAHIGNALHSLGIYPAVIDEADCCTQIFLPYRFLIFPLPDAGSPIQVNAFLNYMRQGGHAGVFHTLPPSIAASMNFPVGKFMKASALPSPLATVVPAGNLLPGSVAFRQQSSAFLSVKPVPAGARATAWWYDANGKNTEYPAILENKTGFWMTHVFLNQDPSHGAETLAAQLERFVSDIRRSGAATRLASARFAVANAVRLSAADRSKARTMLQTAERLYETGQYVGATDFARQSMEALTPSPSAPSAGRRSEIRAVWFRNKDGVAGKTWQETASALKQNGINAVFPCLASIGTGMASSLPACEKACQNQGLRLHVWLECLSIADCPKVVLESFERQKMLQLDATGKSCPWLCPNNSKTRQRLLKLVAELAARQAVTGLHLDFIRFSSSQVCYCPECRAKFQAELQTRAAAWPTDVLPGGRHHDAWQKFRSASLTSLVREITAVAVKTRPTIQLSAAVYPDCQNATKTVGQAWNEWLDRRYVNFVCPMNYRANASQFASDVKRQTATARRGTAILPGIGVANQRLQPAEVQRQIDAARVQQAAGFILFECTPYVFFDVLPKLSIR